MIERQIPTLILSTFVGIKHPELRSTYTETSQKMEKCIKILDIVYLKASPILGIHLALVVSYFKYFITNLGGAAFELPLPMW